ncbi:MAG: DNA repair protein RecO [Prochlorotrichaceae cyanobacterium]
MSNHKTYKLTGINLQVTPIGEADRLLTILSPEQGLIKAIAVGSRKPKAKLGGRTSLFVVNELLLVAGRNFHRIIQAETLESYPGLSQSLGHLAAGQYLIELTLGQALREHPHGELFGALRSHLKQLEQGSPASLFPLLTQASFHLLALAGLAPQVHHCCRTCQAISPNFDDRYWRVGFSIAAGGIIRLNLDEESPPFPDLEDFAGAFQRTLTPLTARELATLQHLALQVGILPETELQRLRERTTPYDPLPGAEAETLWRKLEQLLRDYAQHHLDRPLRSAALLDAL